MEKRTYEMVSTELDEANLNFPTLVKQAIVEGYVKKGPNLIELYISD